MSMPAPPRRVLIGLALLLGLVALAAWWSSRLVPHAAPVYSRSEARGSVWTWDGQAYAGRAAAGPHSTRADMAYDAGRGVVVLWDHGCSRVRPGFDGGCEGRVDATWTWDGTRWQQRRSASSPAEKGQGVMVYDGRAARVVYVNGQGEAWAWSWRGWVPIARGGAPRVAVPGALSRAPASTFAAGYDEARGVLVYALSNATFTWDGRRWASVPGGIPYDESGADPHLAFDRSLGRLVYVGRTATWTWDGASWQRHQQPALGRGTLGYDAARSQLVYVAQDEEACDDAACRTTTWAWDAATWTRLPVSHPVLLPLTRSTSSPPPMTFDAARRELVMFVSAS